MIDGIHHFPIDRSSHYQEEAVQEDQACVPYQRRLKGTLVFHHKDQGAQRDQGVPHLLRPGVLHNKLMAKPNTTQQLKTSRERKSAKFKRHVMLERRKRRPRSRKRKSKKSYTNLIWPNLRQSGRSRRWQRRTNEKMPNSVAKIR